MTSLPYLLLITNRHQMQPNFETALEAALSGGARLIQLREKDLTSLGVLQLAQQTQKLCESYGAQLVINSSADIAAVVGTGIHLPENALRLSTARAMLGSQVLTGVSVHSIEAARSAEEAGADYVVFGSVFPTASHPGEAPQGLEMLRSVVEAVGCPVFAVGGVGGSNMAQCFNAGAHGIAVISAVWSTPDVTSAVQSLLQSLSDNKAVGSRDT